MEFKRYQELKENMLNEYMQEWHDFDITLPSFEQAQEQERQGLILESQKGDDDDMDGVETKLREVFSGKSAHTETKESVGMKDLFNQLSGVSEIPLGSGAEGNIDEIREAFGGTTEMTEAMEEAQYGPLILDSVSIDEIVESEGKPFTFKGKALRVNRRNRNNRRYPKALTEQALQEIGSQVLTIMDGHPKPGDTAVSPVIGKVSFGALDENGWMPYIGQISNTSRGTDIQTLLRDKCVKDVSLRSRGHTTLGTLDGKSIDDVTDLHFRGLDLVTEGSEQGSGVDELLSAMEVS